MNKADSLGESPTFDAVGAPMSSRAASFARFAGQGDPTASPAPSEQAGTLRLSLSALAHNPYNPREELKSVEDLADSLTSRGVIQPLTVVSREAFLAAHPNHEGPIGPAAYVVVDGNRRLAASHLAGLDDVPVHVDDTLALDADNLLETALTAAIQHENLDPLDEARALQRLVEVHGSQRAVARALGKSSPWVTQRLALLKLTPELQKQVESRTLPVEIARNVGQLPGQQQAGAAEVALTRRAAAGKRKQGRSRPAGANGVSTSTPVKTLTGDGSEARKWAGANGVSTSPLLQADSAGSEVVQPPSLSLELSTGGHGSTTDLAAWSDGNALMDLALTRLSPEQRTVFIHRYIQLSGSTEALVADLSRGLGEDTRTQLANILGEVADLLRNH